MRKMGERVLHRMLPILRDSMASEHASTRQVRVRGKSRGECLGLGRVFQLGVWLDAGHSQDSMASDGMLRTAGEEGWEGWKVDLKGGELQGICTAFFQLVSWG